MGKIDEREKIKEKSPLFEYFANYESPFLPQLCVYIHTYVLSFPTLVFAFGPLDRGRSGT